MIFVQPQGWRDDSLSEGENDDDVAYDGPMTQSIDV
jgi:hypothetical protein